MLLSELSFAIRIGLLALSSTESLASVFLIRQFLDIYICYLHVKYAEMTFIPKIWPEEIYKKKYFIFA